MKSGIEIRPARETDWQTLRELRLSALANSPDAFGQTLADAERAEESGWRNWAAGDERADESVSPNRADGRVGSAQVFLAFDRDLPVGMVYASLTAVRAGLGALWVEPASRGSGVATALLATGEAWLTQLGATRFQLSVTEGSAAQRFYLRLGYRPTGERAPMRDDLSLFAVHMAKETVGPPTG